MRLLTLLSATLFFTVVPSALAIECAEKPADPIGYQLTAVHGGDVQVPRTTRPIAVLDTGVDPEDSAAVADLLPRLTFDTPTNPGRQVHRLGDRDVSNEIRSQQVTLAVTPVSANPAVRAHLLDRQQRIARSGRMVVEGRDIGTVVVPEARLKIYLTADAAERARRRHRQNAGVAARSGGSADVTVDLAEVAQDLHRRDTKDSTRTHAPLQAATDAVHIDSSELAVDETVAKVLSLAHERGIR